MIRAIRFVVGAAGAAALLMLLPGGSSGAVSRLPLLGVYTGPHNYASVQQFEDWLGRDVSVVLDYVPADSWDALAEPLWLGLWRSAGAEHRIVLGVPMIPYTGGSLDAGAAGAYNRYFRRLARNLVRIGLGDAILRLGWEFSGGWYPWSVRTDDAARAFAAYWRQIVTTIRSVSPSFQFDWNPALGWRPFRIGLAYPGKAYVDYIGVDIYDQSWLAEGTDLASRWYHMVNGDGGLAWHRAFARWKDKPMTFPEWGLAIREDGHGGGDNPFFVERMHEWIFSNPVAYHAYFDFDAPDGNHALRTGQFPAAAEVFRSKFRQAPAAVAASD